MQASTGETLSAPGTAAPPLPSRKLAVWLFLGSEIVFFSALIFTFIVLRLSAPLPPEEGAWPTPLEIQGSAALEVDVASLDPEYVKGIHLHTADLAADPHDEEAYIVTPEDFSDEVAAGTTLIVPRVLNIPLTALNTFLLILSSVAVVLALDAVQKRNQKGLVRWLAITFVLGVVFLGIQAYEYTILIREGLWFASIPHWLEEAGRTDLFGTTFYAMTGFHGAHVLVGVIMLGIVLVKAIKGYYTAEDHMGVELFGLYWHFVDLVWIILFTVVYLI